jgi:polyphosphate:AMP phosphotransferase
MNNSVGAKEKIKALEIKIASLQRQLREKKIPMIIVFEGWSAAGRGTLISKLIRVFDSRAYNVVTKSVLSEKTEFRPYLYKFWLNTPERGRIAIFERSYYEKAIQKYLTDKDLGTEIEHITDFEKILADDGTIILKIFLQIDKKEQKKRFEDLEKNKNTSWRVTKDDWRQNEKYEKHHRAFDKMMEKSSFPKTPWHTIPSFEIKKAALELYELISSTLENRLGSAQNSIKPKPQSVSTNSFESPTDKIDLSLSMSRDEYEKSLDSLLKKTRILQFKAYKKRLPVIIAFEGCDAAGKGGAIRRLVQGLDPRGFEVIPIAAPSGIEKKHHYLRRFWNRFPKAGHFAIFDRTWYGRVLVERVENFCSENEWARAYAEINEMEKYLTENGTLIIKFWAHISQDEQLKRFKERESCEWKNWKITDDDWRNREKWNLYKKAVDDMLLKTDTEFAPWTIVEAESKLYSRIKILKTIVERLENKICK